MGYTIGVLLALLVSGFARLTGFDRDRARAFYPTVLVVVASYYVLFAVIAGSTRAIVLESIGLSAFALWAAIGFKRSSGVVAAGLAAHGIFDFVHADIVTNPGVPAWWPAFCLGFDLAAAAWLAFFEKRAR